MTPKLIVKQTEKGYPSLLQDPDQLEWAKNSKLYLIYMCEVVHFGMLNLGWTCMINGTAL